MDKTFNGAILSTPLRPKVFENHQNMHLHGTSSKLRSESKRALTTESEMHSALSDSIESPQLQHHSAAEVLSVPLSLHLILCT